MNLLMQNLQQMPKHNCIKRMCLEMGLSMYFQQGIEIEIDRIEAEEVVDTAEEEGVEVVTGI